MRNFFYTLLIVKINHAFCFWARIFFNIFEIVLITKCYINRLWLIKGQNIFFCLFHDKVIITVRYIVSLVRIETEFALLDVFILCELIKQNCFPNQMKTDNRLVVGSEYNFILNRPLKMFIINVILTSVHSNSLIVVNFCYVVWSLR